MYLTIGNSSDAFAQLLTVLLIFVFILILTLYTTRFIAKYQKTQRAGSNIDIVETSRLDMNKCIQIVRIGETYVVIAVCKDTVTVLTQVSKEQLVLNEGEEKPPVSFKDLLEKLKKADTGENK